MIKSHAVHAVMSEWQEDDLTRKRGFQIRRGRGTYKRPNVFERTSSVDSYSVLLSGGTINTHVHTFVYIHISKHAPKSIGKNM